MNDSNHAKIVDLVRAAKRAGRTLARSEGSRRRDLLLAMAEALDAPGHRARLLQVNAVDVEEGRAAQARGDLSQALVARLVLDARKLDGITEGLRQLADMPDLLGVPSVERELDEGLVLCKESCPLGVIGVVFEARPDAVPQIVGLAMRTGNAVVLKGGAEAQRTNRAMVDLLRDVLAAQDLDPAAVSLLEGREDVAALISQERGVDLIVARGSTGFIRYVMANSKIPVLGHAEGLCHMFLHGSAEPAMAARLAVDAKCTYPAACNALETLLWEPGAEAALAASVEALGAEQVQLRGCEHTRARHPDLAPATEEDWATEYGDRILSIRRVDSLEAALAHIERYGSQHTEAIVAEDPQAAAEFLAAVDAAGVFHNASTRFADGFRYGLGAEVGVSTSKLHARGPVGVDGLVTYRWLLHGQGHRTADYGPGKKPFTHRDRRPG